MGWAGDYSRYFVSPNIGHEELGTSPTEGRLCIVWFCRLQVETGLRIKGFRLIRFEVLCPRSRVFFQCGTSLRSLYNVILGGIRRSEFSQPIERILVCPVSPLMFPGNSPGLNP